MGRGRPRKWSEGHTGYLRAWRRAHRTAEAYCSGYPELSQVGSGCETIFLAQQLIKHCSANPGSEISKWLRAPPEAGRRLRITDGALPYSVHSEITSLAFRLGWWGPEAYEVGEIHE